jgi:hypothetical protein
MKKQLKKILKITCIPWILGISNLSLHANEAEVNNLIETIIQASPSEREKLESYKKSIAKKPKKNTKKSEATSKISAIASDMRIPESQLLDASAKFPNNIQGNYIYGAVTFKAVRQLGEEPYIQFGSKNGRIYILYTRDQALLSAFSQITWGTKFTIPKDFPLRLVARLFPGSYVVRLPYDLSNKSYNLDELTKEHATKIKNIFDETASETKSNFGDLQNAIKDLGGAFINPSSE